MQFPTMRLRDGIARAFLFAGLAVVGITAAALGSFDASSGGLRYGASRVHGAPGIAIHWVLCQGETAEVVDIEGYQGGSVGPNGVPVGWQIRTDARGGAPARVETFVVGEVPPGYYQTVALDRDAWGRDQSDDLVAISGPPGGGQSLEGMSFAIPDLTETMIYRGSYEQVDLATFARDGLSSCPENEPRIAQGLGLVALGMGVALLAGGRRNRRFWLGVAVGGLGTLAIVQALAGPPILSTQATFGSETRQAAAAFTSGATTVSADLPVLATISPATARDAGGGLYVARIWAEGEYAFAISCDGLSVQVGEGAEIPNGGTASRQLLGCATGRLVRGGIAGRTDRSALVEIVVNPNGVRGWEVVVVKAQGDVGPYPEP
jgi:hypothetical protein